MMQNKRLPLQLQSIYIRGSETRIREDFDPVTPGQKLSAQILQLPEAAPGLITHNDDGSVFSYTFVSHFEFRYTDKDVDKSVDGPISEADTCAYISADIAAVYRLTGTAPSDDQLAEWFKGATLLHVWPYWREFCGSTLTRMSLPVTMIPTLDVRRPEQQADDARIEDVTDLKKAPVKKRLKKSPARA